jgi:class 3 adenylate cyclase/DNA-binding transcriptional MerR regulator
MISSKELIERGGVSRATLNNYIAQGLLPRPELRSADPSGARVLGYFPADALERVERIRTLKASGWSMSRIASELAVLATTKTSVAPADPASEMERHDGAREAPAPVVHSEGAVHKGRDSGPGSTHAASPIPQSASLRLSLDDVVHPAYMFSYRFELTWYNEPARRQVLGDFTHLPSESDQRHVLPMLVSEAGHRSPEARQELLRSHLQLVLGRLDPDSVLNTLRGQSLGIQADVAALLASDFSGLPQPVPTLPAAVVVPLPAGVLGEECFRLIATYFREGVLVVCVPDALVDESLAKFLSRRDLMISQLLRNRLPVQTAMAVMVASLQGSARICSELPPEEYFELINDIWSAMDPILRERGAIHGKQSGDQVVYFFLPQADSHYAFNALRCAADMRAAMLDVSRAWSVRKGWFNDLHLNIGLHEGHEWLGTFQTATRIEFAVLGDTISQAARLSGLARDGAVWASKALIGKLSSEERHRVHYGVARRNQEGREVFISSTFAQFASLVDVSASNASGGLSNVAVAEVRRVG